jgi:hypothetical protein
MTEDEAVLLHEPVAFSEFAEDLDVIDLPASVDKEVFSDLQQALAGLVPELGLDGYSARVDRAHQAIDPGDY